MKILRCFGHFGNTLYLPGDLIDVVFFAEVFGVMSGVLALVKALFIEQSERVVIARVPPKIAGTGRFRDKKAKQVKVKSPARLQLGSIKAEVTEAANFKGPVKRDPADVVFLCHGYLLDL